MIRTTTFCFVVTERALCWVTPKQYHKGTCQMPDKPQNEQSLTKSSYWEVSVTPCAEKQLKSAVSLDCLQSDGSFYTGIRWEIKLAWSATDKEQTEKGEDAIYRKRRMTLPVVVNGTFDSHSTWFLRLWPHTKRGTYTLARQRMCLNTACSNASNSCIFIWRGQCLKETGRVELQQGTKRPKVHWDICMFRYFII